MFDFDDPWWTAALILVVGMWLMGVVIPIRMIAPTLNIAKSYADLQDDTQQQTPPPPPPPSIFLPVLVFVVSLGVTALSIIKRIQEPEGGNRWVWMSAASGLAGFWALVLIMITIRVATRAG